MLQFKFEQYMLQFCIEGYKFEIRSFVSLCLTLEFVPAQTFKWTIQWHKWILKAQTPKYLGFLEFVPNNVSLAYASEKQHI